MELTLEIISLAILVLLFNVLDSATTALCFRQYPDKELKGEGNPVMRWLMLKNRNLAEVVKHGIVLGFVVYWLLGYNIFPLRLAAIMLGLVVINNSAVFLSRVVLKRKVDSPLKRFMKLVHVPDTIGYVAAIFIILFLSLIIYALVWGNG